jgi:hypothetical protein
LKIILYHGTDSLFEDIDLTKSKERRDFGVGFYTTTISSQAEGWARSKKKRNHSLNAYVYVYEAHISDSLSVCEHIDMSLEWLEMIKTNRELGGIQHNYDIVIGPVANDDTMLTVSRYIAGVYTSNEAIERLKYSKANNQVSFHTNNAIKVLKFIRRYKVD